MSGLYAVDGSWNVTVVDGATFVGLYAIDGSYNVVDQTANSNHVSAQHACGALNVTLDTGSVSVAIQASTGALNVTTSPFNVNGGQRVTVLSGSLGIVSGGSHAASILLEDGSSYLLLQDGSSILLQ